jgi:hypothetical protein
VHTSVAWNSITLNNSSKLEQIQRKFADLYHSRLFIGTCYNRYEDILVSLNLSTLHSRCQFCDALFLINVFKEINCSSIINTVSLQVPTKSARDFSTFNIWHNYKVSPLATCISAANVACSQTDIF